MAQGRVEFPIERLRNTLEGAKEFLPLILLDPHTIEMRKDANGSLYIVCQTTGYRSSDNQPYGLIYKVQLTIQELNKKDNEGKTLLNFLGNPANIDPNFNSAMPETKKEALIKKINSVVEFLLKNGAEPNIPPQDTPAVAPQKQQESEIHIMNDETIKNLVDILESSREIIIDDQNDKELIISNGTLQLAIPKETLNGLHSSGHTLLTLLTTRYNQAGLSLGLEKMLSVLPSKAEANKPDLSKINTMADIENYYQIDEVKKLHFVKIINLRKIIKASIKCGANVNQLNSLPNAWSNEEKDREKYSPLHIAASLGSAELVKLLLENGADPTIKDGQGNTTLQWARNAKNQETIDLLNPEKKSESEQTKAEEKSYNVKLLKGENSALHAAVNKSAMRHANNGQLDILVELLSKKIPGLIDHKGKDGLTALNYYAQQRKQISLFGNINLDWAAELLLLAGANPNIPDDKGLTPLHYALDNHDVGLIELLLKHKANVKIKDQGQRSPLYIASNMCFMKSYSEDGLKLTKLLLEYKAELNEKNQAGDTPLDIALEFYKEHPEGALAFIKLVVEKHPHTLNFTDKYEMTLLDKALSRGNVDVVKLLLQAGATVTEKSLMRAIGEPKDNVEIVELMIKSASKEILNHQDLDKWTCLHAAVYIGNMRVARLLIENGADVTIKNKEKETALDVAKKDPKGKEDIIALLTEKAKSAKSQPVEPKSQPKKRVKITEPHEEPQPKEPEIEEKSSSELADEPKTSSFADILQKSAADIITDMKWTAYPKIHESDVVYFKETTSKIKNLNFGELTDNAETQRTLFNLALYSSKLPNGVKKTGLEKLIVDLSKAPENATKLIKAALINETLIKNTGTGLFKFFHSGPNKIHNHEKNDRWARSTTEELLIAFDEALNPKAVEDDQPEEVSVGPST